MDGAVFGGNQELQRTSWADGVRMYLAWQALCSEAVRSLRSFRVQAGLIAPVLLSSSRICHRRAACAGKCGPIPCVHYSRQLKILANPACASMCGHVRGLARSRRLLMGSLCRHVHSRVWACAGSRGQKTEMIKLKIKPVSLHRSCFAPTPSLFQSLREPPR